MYGPERRWPEHHAIQKTSKVTSLKQIISSEMFTFINVESINRISITKWPKPSSFTEQKSPNSTKINWITFWGKFVGSKSLNYNVAHLSKYRLKLPISDTIRKLFSPERRRNKNWSSSKVSSALDPLWPLLVLVLTICQLWKEVIPVCLNGH